jgi:hypothetical protein
MCERKNGMDVRSLQSLVVKGEATLQVSGYQVPFHFAHVAA